MTPFVRLVIVGAATILAFDSVASFASLLAGIPYGWFTLGSITIYTAFAYRVAPEFGHTRAVVATVLVALTEATLGWAVSWVIGPGRPPAGVEVTPMTVVATGAIVSCVMGSFFGWVGARLALRTDAEKTA